MLAGRVIGAIGAAFASVLWGIILLAIVALLLKPNRGWEGLALLALIPVAPLICMMFVVSVLGFVVLVRRADRGNPWRLAATHVVLGVSRPRPVRGWRLRCARPSWGRR